jgi:hypothetical protein
MHHMHDDKSGKSEEAFPATTLPPLAKPFALFGAAAGLFAILALGAYREAAREVSPLVPLVITAGVGAAVGVTLRKWQRLHEPQSAREAVVLWLALVMAGAGCASGGAIGLITWGTSGVVRFALGGAVVALGFTPSCLVVFEAARRAGRGRLGSLVAATDARTVKSTVLAGVAFAAATQVPAILTVQTSSAFSPLVQDALSLVTCFAAMMGIVVLQSRDRVARATLDDFVKDTALAQVESSDTDADDARRSALAALDLGIGAQEWSRQTAAHYRSSARADVLVKGSIAEATVAFDECSRRRHRSLMVAACGLTAVTVSVGLRLSVLL